MVKHYEFVTVTREHAVTIVTIAREAAMNAVHEPANNELNQVFDDIAADPAQRVAVLTGAGDRAFSAGNDLKSVWSSSGPESMPNGFAGLTWRCGFNKPLIAAVNGLALGGGFEAALACDIIIAAEHAVFALPEPRVGVAALGGGLHRLPRSIGLHRAMSLILTGRQVTAAEGLSLGFVAEVVAKGATVAAARRWARLIGECSPQSLRASKQAVNHGLELSLEEWRRSVFELPEVIKLLESTDALEGARAFVEKRAPLWST